MTRSIQVAVLALAALPLASCGASRQYFRPTERVTSESYPGIAVAEYDLGTDGRRWGEVRVWSDGAFTERGGPTVLYVSFEVENVTDEPFELDVPAMRVESVEGDLPVPEPIAPAGSRGRVEISPRSVRVVELEFPMPPSTAPDDLRSFRVHWLLHGPGDWVYEQYTGFVAERPQRYYRPHYYYHGYWGPAWHVGPYWSFGGFYWCY